MKHAPFRRVLTALSLCALITATASATTTWQRETTEDAFVAVGSGSNPAGSDLTANNYGGAGTLEISPATSTKGEFQSLLKFNLLSSGTTFDAQYGSGNWYITNITLTLASNFGVQGAQPNNNIFNVVNSGGFIIEWLSDDSWTEGTGNPSSPTQSGVTYNSLGSLLTSSHEILGSYSYTPPGNNVPLTWTLGLTSGFLADATASGNISLLLRAADNSVGYLFNARTFASNHPLITVTAIPEPSALFLLPVAGAVLGVAYRRSRRA